MLSKQQFNLKSIFKGMIFSFTVTVILIILIGAVSYFSDISDKIISFLLFLSSIISVLLGALLVTKNAPQNGLLHGAVLGIGYFIIIFASSIIAKKEFQFTKTLLTLLIADTAGGMLGGVLGINSGKKY